MDGGHVRLLAHRVHGLADGVRAAAARAAGTTDVAWTSVAAEEFRARLAVEAARAVRAAGLLDDAAAALLRHASVLDATGAALRWPR